MLFFIILEKICTIVGALAIIGSAILAIWFYIDSKISEGEELRKNFHELSDYEEGEDNE